MEGRLAELLAIEPVVRLVGPRASGKTFTSQRVIEALGGTVLRLDDPDERELAAADPSGYLADRPAPVLIDEYQHVPELLATIKSQLSARGASPGRYLLTGSVRAELVGQHEHLTGRVHRARLHPLSQGELLRLPTERFLAAALDDPANISGWRDTQRHSSLDALDAACRGGFPLAVDRPAAARGRWLRDYVQDTVLRDALDHAAIRKPQEMLRLLRLLAARTSQVAHISSVGSDLRLDRHTVSAYLEVLDGLFVTRLLPPWRSNRSQRVVKSPKLHVADTALAVSLLGLDRDGLRRDATLAGQIAESFVVNEITKQASWLDVPPTLLHFSESERTEVDLVIERPDGRLIGVEIKLASRVRDKDLAGLRRLRDLAAARWHGGVLLNTVPGASTTDDGLVVAPLSSVWGYS